jgi:hypothetical protein
VKPKRTQVASTLAAAEQLHTKRGSVHGIVGKAIRLYGTPLCCPGIGNSCGWFDESMFVSQEDVASKGKKLPANAGYHLK